MIPGVGAFTGAVDPNQVAAGADLLKALLSARLRSHGDVQIVLSPLTILTPAFLQDLAEVAQRRPWVVLFFDTYQRTGPLLDVWLRDVLVSDRYGELPANVLVVLAGQSRLESRCWGTTWIWSPACHWKCSLRPRRASSSPQRASQPSGASR
ncbi:hypothetical protein QFZ55_000190 [Streptomyces luteogriseus]|uniref:hypothetical protein n=1 Tax=Streptomyces luteogriseus TaxID=68233 RepID=UPI00278771F1|nr:hypothetical protein [Streptomyces luteogriseus]MDQ0710738.1 hypothetical protein [Streptomyces luteogriseus]